MRMIFFVAGRASSAAGRKGCEREKYGAGQKNPKSYPIHLLTSILVDPLRVCYSIARSPLTGKPLAWNQCLPNNFLKATGFV